MSDSFFADWFVGQYRSINGQIWLRIGDGFKNAITGKGLKYANRQQLFIKETED